MQRRDALKLCLATLGTALSPTLQQALASESALHTRQHTLLSDLQHQNVATAAELIIPTTDTPGAIAARVPEFIDHIFSHWMTEPERNIFSLGLQRLEQASQTRERSHFFEARHAFQVELLQQEEQVALTYVSDAPVRGVGTREHDPKTPFFSVLKELVVVGYYTSEIGCKQEQIYTPMHGQYEGNLTYSDFNRRFSS